MDNLDVSANGKKFFESNFYTEIDPKSITPSGYFGDSPDNIVEVENFLTEHEISYLELFIQNNKHWDITESRWDDEGTMIYDAEYWKDRVATWHTLERSILEVIDVHPNAIV